LCRYLEADGVKASHLVSRLAQKQGSTPYLVWLDQDDVGNMLVKMAPVEAAQMLEGLSSRVDTFHLVILQSKHIQLTT
jgi:hypothetical protein